MVDFQMAEHYSVDSLRRIMELLRAPGGCPWDRAQTHQSIRANMLEEAYEAVDAIDHMDMDNLKEELGDVLLQVVFHACMAQEAGRFTFDDVVDGICKKLVYRHPHVFGAAEAGDAEGALSAWDAQKRREKGQKTNADALDSVARALPALTRASKLQGKAAKAAVREGSNMEEELGDLLFAAVKVGRFVQVDGERALQGACEKFIRRFRRVEALAEGPLERMDVPALEALWQKAKEEEA